MSGRGVGESQVACFDVDDTGSAVDQEAMNALFEPFAQTEDARTPRFDGPNLSLALCLRLARLLGGDLTAAPSAGGGVRFTMTVPVSVKGQ